MDDKMTREEAEKVCTYWGINNTEELSHEDADEAIREYLIGFKPGELPTTVRLHGFVKKKVTYSSGVLLERMLEDLDEEYRDDFTEPTESMKAAEQAFIAAVLAEYKPYWCDEVYKEEIDVAAWVKSHSDYRAGQS